MLIIRARSLPFEKCALDSLDGFQLLTSAIICQNGFERKVTGKFETNTDPLKNITL